MPPNLSRLADNLIAYEEEQLSEPDTLSLFQDLIDTGLAWTLQGTYGRTAHSLLRAGLCNPPTPCSSCSQ